MRLKSIVITIIASLLLLTPSASASDHRLGIFGNANEDDSIDLKDVEYTASVVLGLDNQTQLADAKYDGEIDILDVTQIELIMLGKEKELTVIDSGDRTVTVNKPIESTVICFPHVLETLRLFKAPVDSIAGIARHWPEYDPEATHHEYLTRFQGLDIDLNEKGVFVYPTVQDSCYN